MKTPEWMESFAGVVRSRHTAQCGDTKPHVSRMHLKSVNVDMEQRLVKGLLARESVDMEGEVIVPAGIKFGNDAYFPGTTAAVYLDHSWKDEWVAARDRMPIGTCRSIGLRGDSIFAQTKIAKTALGDEVLVLIDEGAIRGKSISVLSFEEGPPTADERSAYGMKCWNVVRSSAMLEYSLVSMPAHPDAVIKSYDRGLVRRVTVAMLFPELDLEIVRKSYPTTGPAKVSRKVVLLDEHLDVSAVMG